MIQFAGRDLKRHAANGYPVLLHHGHHAMLIDRYHGCGAVVQHNLAPGLLSVGQSHLPLLHGDDSSGKLRLPGQDGLLELLFVHVPPPFLCQYTCGALTISREKAPLARGRGWFG